MENFEEKEEATRGRNEEADTRKETTLKMVSLKVGPTKYDVEN